MEKDKIVDELVPLKWNAEKIRDQIYLQYKKTEEFGKTRSHNFEKSLVSIANISDLLLIAFLILNGIEYLLDYGFSPSHLVISVLNEKIIFCPLLSISIIFLFLTLIMRIFKKISKKKSKNKRIPFSSKKFAKKTTTILNSVGYTGSTEKLIDYFKQEIKKERRQRNIILASFFVAFGPVVAGIISAFSKKYVNSIYDIPALKQSFISFLFLSFLTIFVFIYIYSLLFKNLFPTFLVFGFKKNRIAIICLLFLNMYQDREEDSSLINSFENEKNNLDSEYKKMKIHMEQQTKYMNKLSEDIKLIREEDPKNPILNEKIQEFTKKSEKEQEYAKENIKADSKREKQLKKDRKKIRTKK